MKTFNIWECNNGETYGSTGPWRFVTAVVCKSPLDALKLAVQRYGRLPSAYAIYEGLS